MLLDLLSYAFMQKALISGIFIAISCSSLGIFLVLRRYAMIGEGLGHMGFAAIALAVPLGFSPYIVTIPVLMFLSLFILRLEKNATLYGEIAVALVSALSLAVGVLIASISKGFNVDLFSFLFGSILSISDAEVYISIALSFFVSLVLLYYYHDLFALTYDEDFARVSGVRTDKIGKILILLTALTVALGIRVVGSLLVSSLIIFPAVTALQFSRGFRDTILISVLSGIFSVIAGIIASFILDLPTGASIVVANFLLFAAAFVFSKRTSSS